MKTTIIVNLILVALFSIACGRRSGPQGPAGINGTNGVDGTNGKDGINGINGVDGKDGSACHVEQLSDGSRIYCDDGTEAIVSNGVNGTAAILNIIDPCGDFPNHEDEILIVTDQGILAYFEDGGKRFLAKLSAGSYRTTDKQACSFTVDANGNVSF